VNKNLKYKDTSGLQSWGLGEGLRTPHRKISACYEMLYNVSELAGS